MRFGALLLLLAAVLPACSTPGRGWFKSNGETVGGCDGRYVYVEATARSTGSST